MASRQSVSSILKPSKVRAPLKEIEPVDQEADENTESLPKRKVSFSGMNKIKMYNTGATSLTVHQAPMFDEQISILSDSSNADKTKLLLEASQKSNQTTVESTNCTTMEDNNCVCIEYECPNDNMEMTEALSCKIFSDTIYTENNENNGFEHDDYNSDYSNSNMEFTEVIKTAKILTNENDSDFSSAETLNDNNKHPDAQSSNMELTEVIKTAKILTNENDSDFSSTETLNDNNKHPDAQSSNMELTCVTSFQKSILPHCKSDMELTELTDRKIHENNCELVFEQDQHSMSTTSEISSDISMDIDQTSEGNDINFIIDNSKLLVSEQNESLEPKPTEYEQHNYSDLLIDIDNQNIQPSPSLVSTGLSFFSEMLDSNKPCKVEELKEDILNTNTSTVDQYHLFENNKIKNYSRKSMAHTNTLIVEEKSTKNTCLLNTSVVVEENDQKNCFIKSQTQSLEKENTLHASVILEENQQINDLVSIHNEYQPSKYENNVPESPVVIGSQQKRARKSIALTPFHNESQSSENDETLNTLSTLEENQQKKYSRKSIAPTLFHNESQSSENDEISNTPVMLEENQQKRYSRKSIASTLFHNESQSSENDEISSTHVMLGENQQKRYSHQSNAPVLIHNESQSSENDETLNTLSTLEENQQKKYSRKSIAPLSIHNESKSSKDENNVSDSPVVIKSQQKRYSNKSFAPALFNNESQSFENNEISNAPTLIHNESQSFENEDISDTPVVVEENQQNIYCRKSIAPTLYFNDSKFSESEGTSISNQTRSPIVQDLLDTSITVKENRPKKYSRKTVGPSSILVHREPPKYIDCDNNFMDEESSKSNSRMSMTCVTTKCISDISLMSNNSNIQLLDSSNKHEDKCISKTELKPAFSDMIVDDDFNSPFRKKSRLSVALSNLKSETANENNPSENYEETDKMDISVELSNDNSMLNMSSKELHISSPSCLLNDLSHSFQKKNSFEEKSEMSEKSPRKEKYLNNLTENIEKLEEVKNDSLQISDNMNMVNQSLKFEDDSIPHNVDKIVNNICTESLSNISISNKTHANYKQSFTENRKRSYTNRDINYEESAIEKDFEVVPIKEDSFEENLNNEVIEFLEKWEKQFIDKILVKVKCTNSKWIFNALNDNIVLTIKYFPILKNHNFLKVEDISFTTKNIIQHEIIKFGINWILSKYDPKVYKQVCFSSRDIELLLKSLLEDVTYISKVMNNMFYVSDMYCVKFKDNLAQFCLHSMKCLSMTSIQISLANIHKLSVKDITVNCLFGSFNINLLNEILKELPKDYNILESLIVQLKDQMYR